MAKKKTENVKMLTQLPIGKKLFYLKKNSYERSKII